MQYYSLKFFRSARAHVVQHFITLVLGKLCHAKQWPTPTSPLTPVIISLLIAKRDKYPCHAKQWPTPTSPLTPVIISLLIAKRDKYPCHAKQWPTPTSPLTPVIISLLIAKRDKYPCHAKQWPTPTSLSKGYPTQLKLALCVPAWLELPLHAQ
jgi:hypothetical protein